MTEPTKTATIDWHDYGVYYTEQMPRDWQHVLSIQNGGGYDWATLHAFYSPREHMFYWYGSSGCSCNSWGSDLRTASDFNVGTINELRKELRSFVEERSYNFPSDYAQLKIRELHDWFLGIGGASEVKP